MSKIVTPEEAQALMAAGHTYVDVRSEAEFAAGHPKGALNVPVTHIGPAGAEPNQDFVAVMERAFEKDAPLVVGCQSGGRSRRAVAMLEAAGFSGLSDMSAGFAGARDAFGRATPGWSKLGLPIEQGTPEGQSYANVKSRSR
jgi:rhodanese-related sulfurtransferase